MHKLESSDLTVEGATRPTETLPAADAAPREPVEDDAPSGDPFFTLVEAPSGFFDLSNDVGDTTITPLHTEPSLEPGPASEAAIKLQDQMAAVSDFSWIDDAQRPSLTVQNHAVDEPAVDMIAETQFPFDDVESGLDIDSLGTLAWFDEMAAQPVEAPWADRAIATPVAAPGW